MGSAMKDHEEEIDCVTDCFLTSAPNVTISKIIEHLVYHRSQLRVISYKATMAKEQEY